MTHTIILVLDFGQTKQHHFKCVNSLIFNKIMKKWSVCFYYPKPRHLYYKKCNEPCIHSQILQAW